jgi:hypothetical protein
MLNHLLVDLSQTFVQFICLLLNHGAGLRGGKKLGGQFGLPEFGACGFIEMPCFLKVHNRIGKKCWKILNAFLRFG